MIDSDEEAAFVVVSLPTMQPQVRLCRAIVSGLNLRKRICSIYEELETFLVHFQKL